MGLTDYSALENDIVNAQEPTVLPKGTEVKARIITVRSGVSDKNGAQWYSPVFDVPSEPLAMEFNDFFWDLADRDKITEKDYQRGLLKMKVFAAAFGIDISKPFDWEEDLNGLEGWMILGVKTSDEYGKQNTVSKYIVGQ